MLFKKEKWLEDEELGFLKAKTLIFETSTIKWKKRIDFLGFDLSIGAVYYTGVATHPNHPDSHSRIGAVNFPRCDLVVPPNHHSAVSMV